MTKLQYTLVGSEDGSNLSVFIPGQAPQVAHSSHPNFEAILEGVLAGDESVIGLFDVALTAASKFERLSDRVTTANGRLYLDGDEVDNSLAKQVVRFLKEGQDDWLPLVLFFEKVQQNPNEHSREQLFTWLDKRDFTITQDGDIIGYKGVARQPDGSFVSVSAGKAIVNGEVHTGQIPNPIGATIEMPREEVHHDPSTGCSTGLHVGNYRYANSFARGGLLACLVNPRDVVSVPTDSDWEKVRVCRYVVAETIEVPYTEPVVFYDRDEDEGLSWGEQEWDEDEPECEDCGEFEDDCDCW